MLEVTGILTHRAGSLRAVEPEMEHSDPRDGRLLLCSSYPGRNLWYAWIKSSQKINML